MLIPQKSEEEWGGNPISFIITKDYSQALSWQARVKQAEPRGGEATNSYRYIISVLSVSPLLVSIVALHSRGYNSTAGVREMLWLVALEWLPDVHPGPLFTQTSYQVASANFRYLPQPEPVTLSSLCSVFFFLLIKKKRTGPLRVWFTTCFTEEMSHMPVVSNSSSQTITATNSDIQVDEYYLIFPLKRTFTIKPFWIKNTNIFCFGTSAS